MRQHIEIEISMDYKGTYRDFFCYGDQDYIPSEISGSPAVDVHHIKFKSRGGDNEIENLIALTRGEHNLAHSGYYTEDFLRQVHLKFMRERRPDYKPKINGDERMGKGK